MIWEPVDTHPGYRFEVEPVDAFHYACSGAWQDGVPLDDPQAALDAVHAEHVAINIYVATAKNRLPPEMKRLLIDEDGDLVLDESGLQVWVCKAKHEPVIIPSPVGTKTVILIPGTKAYPSTIKDMVAFEAEVRALIADHPVIASHQDKTATDLFASVALQGEG